MADKGFLEDLGVGGVDERQLAAANRQAQKDNFRLLGMGARRGVAALGAGVGGLLTGSNYAGGDKKGRSFGGFLQNMAAGAAGMEDFDAAQAAGISLEDLYARRDIRKELSKEERGEGEDIYDYRERLAARAAKIAEASGSVRHQSAALDELKRTRDERMEFDKLKTAQARADQQLLEEGIMTGYDEKGDPLTGTLGTDYTADGELVAGLWYSDGQGGMLFKAWGDGFTAEDPTVQKRKGETLDARFRKSFGKGHVDDTRTMVQANATTMRKIERVAANMRDLQKMGMADSVISSSGEWVSWADNFVRNIQGGVRAFLGPRTFKPGDGMTARFVHGQDAEADPQGRYGGRNKESWSGMSAWYGRALDPNDSMWDNFQLPEWAQGVSQAAQEHRAQIMELAYMAARLAEPSNRGLSDKDIEAALTRISGDTSNPQQIMNRFMTIVYDSGMELEDRLKSYYNAIEVEDLSEEENRMAIDKYFGGDLIGEYRKRRTKLYEDFGVSVDQYGRPIFDNVLGTQVEPNSGVIQTPENPTVPEAPKTEAEIEAELDALFE